MLRIAHISDLHFAKASFSLKQFMSKRWVGNFNTMLIRNFFYSQKQLFQLPRLFKKLNVDYIIITGDFTATSQVKEFELAQAFLATFKDNDIKILSIPGNHDHYTKSAFLNKRFYHFLENMSPNHNFPTKSYKLKEHGVESFPLDGKWWYVGIDTALATPILSSRGLFSEKIEHELINLLAHIPKDFNILVVNHFPFLPHGSKRKILVRGSRLKAILENTPQVKIYLHGHTHKHKIISSRPLILDSGSVTSKRSGSFNLITLTHHDIEVDVYRWRSKQWQLENSFSF